MNKIKKTFIQKKICHAIFVIVMLLNVTLVAGEAPPGAPTHEILYANTIEAKTGSDVNLVGNIFLNDIPLGLGYWNRPDNNIYYTAGNVGIGTDSPDSTLELSGPGGDSEGLTTRLRLTVTNAGPNIHAPGIEFLNPNTSLTEISKLIARDGRAFSFEFDDPALAPSESDKTELMVIRTNGNVGIGTTTPSNKLGVNGNIQATGIICDSTGCIGMDPGGKGDTFIRWGRTTCPEGSELVYDGYSAGSYYSHGGKQPLCLSKIPTWEDFSDVNQNGNMIYGVEYSISGYGLASLNSLHDYEAPCAVCYSEAPTFMHPGSQECPDGWDVLYEGYLMGAHYTHGGGAEAVCVDENPESIGSNANNDGHLWYPTEAECGSLPCGPYVQDRELTCSVCGKNDSDGSGSEGGALPLCTDGQILKYDGGWGCATEESSGGTGSESLSGKTVYPASPQIRLWTDVWRDHTEESRLVSDLEVELTYDFSAAPAGATHAILQGTINMNFYTGQATCSMYAVDAGGNEVHLTFGEGGDVAGETAEEAQTGIGFVSIPEGNVMTFRNRCTEGGEIQYSAYVKLLGYLVEETGGGSGGTSELECTRVTTGWGTISLEDTLEVDCPASYEGVSCVFHYYDTVAGGTYHGFNRGGWDDSRSTCTKTIADGGMTEGELYAECCRGGSSIWSQTGSDTYYNSGNIGIGTAEPYSKLQVGARNEGIEYLQMDTHTSPPPESDCDHWSERGRMMYYEDLNRIYFCSAGGWRYIVPQE